MKGGILMCCGKHELSELKTHEGNNVSFMMKEIGVFLYNTDLKMFEDEEKNVLAGRAAIAVKRGPIGHISMDGRFAIKAYYIKDKNWGRVDIWEATQEWASNEELFGQIMAEASRPLS